MATSSSVLARNDAAESTKPIRKRGVACDACRFRKVKCNRQVKIENRLSKDESDSCSICSSHGLRCTFTQTAPIRRNGIGKRILAIQKVQSSEVVEEPTFRLLQQSGPSSIPCDSLFGTDAVTQREFHDDLLGVRGLTKPLLDACVKSYFKFSEPCSSILKVETYTARYDLYFAQYHTHKGVRPSRKTEKQEASREVQPLSELLLLSVGCIGASVLEHPIADFGSRAKFVLQNCLALRFQELINGHDLLLRLQLEGTDVIEACYIMSDPMLTILGDELPSRSTIDWSAIGQMDQSQRDPLRLRPASHEGIVRLIMKMGINQNPKVRKEVQQGDDRRWHYEGVPVNEQEVFRRSQIFWCVFMQDSFRAMRERRNVLIGSNDYDIDLLRFVPDRPGRLTAQFPFNNNTNSRGQNRQTSASNLPPATSKFAKLDAFQLEVMLRLAFIIRTVLITFVSPRSRNQGVLVTDVDRAVNSLEAWFQQLPNEVTWEYQSRPLMKDLRKGSKGSSDLNAIRNSLRALFVESLYHANVLEVWGSVDAFGTRLNEGSFEAVDQLTTPLTIGDDPTPSSAMLDPSSPAIPTMRPTHSSSAASSIGPGPNQKESKIPRDAVKQRLTNLTVQSFLRLAHVAKEAAQLGLVRAYRLVFFNVFCLYAVWGCGLACKLHAMESEGPEEGINALLMNIPPGYDHCEYIFKLVGDLIYAVGEVDSAEEAPEKVKVLKELLLKSREKCLAMMNKGFTSNTAYPTESNEGMDGSDGESNDAASPHDAPFRSYYKSRGRCAFGDMFEGIIAKKTMTGVQQGNASMMERDEVALLAQAAQSNDSVLRSEGSNTNGDRSYLPQAAGNTKDADFDNSLNTIPGLDTAWLQQYLQGTTSSGQDGVTTSTNTTEPLNSSAYLLFHSDDQIASEQSQSQAGASQFFTPLPPFSHVDANGAASETQWEQFMAYSDAQVWADAQWQGFNGNSSMS